MYIVLVIGFIDTPYTVNENDGFARMKIGVLSDTINFDVSLLISLLNGSASGKSIL